MILDVFPKLYDSMTLGGPFICRKRYHKVPLHPKPKRTQTQDTADPTQGQAADKLWEAPSRQTFKAQEDEGHISSNDT